MPSEPSTLRYASAPGRRQLILELVTTEGFSTITELSTALEVSEMTVRRDVDRLSQTGHVRRVHGGITVLSAEAATGNDFVVRSAVMAEEKRAIAAAAVGFIAPGATIGIDAGTTTLELARLLPDDYRLTVATHSVPVMATLVRRPGVSVFGLGGDLHHTTHDFAGSSTLAAISDLRIDMLFLAAAGLSPRGVYCATDHEALVKRALIGTARRVVLLADSSKFGSSAMIRVCELDVVNDAVMDDGVASDDLALLKGGGVEVTLVSRAAPSSLRGVAKDQ